MELGNTYQFKQYDITNATHSLNFYTISGTTYNDFSKNVTTFGGVPYTYQMLKRLNFEKLNLNKISKLNVVFCPEFLKEKTFKEDMYNANFCLLGTNCDENMKHEVGEVMRHLYSHKTIDVIYKTYEECELFKYTINVFLAVKVWYFNEINILSDKFGVDYNKFKTLFKLEPRLGSSHLDVPGPDGNRGFGGKCLPKETKGMCYLQDKKGINNEILQKILDRNISIRGEEP